MAKVQIDITLSIIIYIQYLVDHFIWLVRSSLPTHYFHIPLIAVSIKTHLESSYQLRQYCHIIK